MFPCKIYELQNKNKWCTAGVSLNYNKHPPPPPPPPNPFSLGGGGLKWRIYSKEMRQVRAWTVWSDKSGTTDSKSPEVLSCSLSWVILSCDGTNNQKQKKRWKRLRLFKSTKTRKYYKRWFILGVKDCFKASVLQQDVSKSGSARIRSWGTDKSSDKNLCTRFEWWRRRSKYIPFFVFFVFTKFFVSNHTCQTTVNKSNNFLCGHFT